MEGIATVRRRQGRRQTPRTILNRTVWVVRGVCRSSECGGGWAGRAERGSLLVCRAAGGEVSAASLACCCGRWTWCNLVQVGADRCDSSGGGTTGVWRDAARHVAGPTL